MHAFAHTHTHTHTLLNSNPIWTRNKWCNVTFIIWTKTGRPRAIWGQRYLLPCFAWLWIRVQGSRAAAPKGTNSCRTQGDFRSSFCPSVHLFPPGPLRPEICPLRPWIYPLRPEICPLKPWICESRFKAWEGRFQAWEGRIQAGEGRIQAWEGRFQAWEGRFKAWEGRFQAWEGRFQAWEGRFQAWEGLGEMNGWME